MRHFIYFILWTILSLPASSQKTEIVNTSKFSQKDGLSSYNIRKVTQDKWGFIWIGTQDGLSKFNGCSFINYTKNSQAKFKLSGTDVRELIEDTSKNLLWVLPGETGINAINTITGEVQISAHIPNSSNDDWNITMLKYKDKIWIGTATGIKIYDITKNRFDASPLLPATPKNAIDFAVRSIVNDDYGNIWVCYDRYGIVIYNGVSRRIIKEVTISELNDHRISHEIRFLKCLLLKGNILFATNQGLRQIYYSKNYDLKIENFPCHAFPSLNTENIDYVTSDKENNILISGFNKFIKFNRSLDSCTILEEPARISETDWLNAVQCIYADRENNIWLGCEQGLAFISNKSNPFKPYNYDKTNNTKLDHVRSIYCLSNDDILVGLINGLVTIDRKTGTYTMRDTGHLYHHIFQDKKGRVHVSRPDGMFIYDNGTLQPIDKFYPEFSPFLSISINSHLFVGDSLVILGSENNNGILLWNPLKKRVRKLDQGSEKNSLSSDIVNNIYLDSKKNLWVLSDNVITVLFHNFTDKKEIVINNKTSKEPYKLFFDMCEANGSYWIASYGSGILQLDTSFNLINVLNTENGLSNDGVYQLYGLLNKYLMVTSNNGLSVFDFNSRRFKNYYVEDGLHSNAFEEVCGMKKGKFIYAGGVNGFTIIDPSKFAVSTKPPIFYFTNVKIESPEKTIDTTCLEMNNIVIANNWIQTNVNFVGLNYCNPARVTYKYRIRELNKSWIDIGTRNFINFIGLSPGSYTLEVKTANEDGFWSPAKQLILVFQPTWYQTLLFKIIVILSIAGLFYWLYLFRISQIKQQQLIRKNIASDLHDDIGSTLNSVKVFAHLAKRDIRKKEHLDNIEEALTEATLGLRDMIWVLDNSDDTANELIERIKKFAVPVTTANNINFEIDTEIDISNQKLSKTEKRNLLMMAKEIINNSLKYAECRNIKLSFRKKRDLSILIIADDGKGFIRNDNTGGNGIRNLYHRAKQIGYDVEITSVSGNGTSIKIRKL